MGERLQWARTVGRRVASGAQAWFSRTSVRAAFGIVAVLLVLAFVATHSALAAEGDGPGILGNAALWIGGLFMYMASGIGSVIGIIIQVIVAVTQYNHFATSPVVSAGWAIVRDAVNMFYVVILIVIAFGTIIGMSRFQWKQQVPKLLLWAIIINFSKTLCGLAIDASQVVTLTFANALKDIAGGNFISFLGLTDIMSISKNADQISGLKDAARAAQGIVPADFMISGVLALVLMLIVLSVLLALVAILAFRIVMLWILITISPLAWFVGSIKGIVHSDAYSEWWNNFKCYLVIGPVLTFFLWLSLAVAGAGNIASLEGFNVADTGSSSIINKIFDLPRITSFILGISMIMAGFKVAAQMCGSVQGGSIISGALGKARSFTKGFGSAGLSLGKGITSRIPLVGSRGNYGRIPNRNQIGLAATRRAQSLTRNIPGVGSALTSKLGKAATHFEHEEHARHEEEGGAITAAGAAFMNKDQEKKFMKEASDDAKKGKKMFTGANQNAVVGKLAKAVGNKKALADLEAEGHDVGALMSTYGHDIEHLNGDDEKKKGAWKDFQTENAHYFTPGKENPTTGKMEYDYSDMTKDPEKMKKMNFDAINPDKIKPREGEKETDKSFIDRKQEATDRRDQLAAQMKGASSGEVDKDGTALNQYAAARLGKMGGKATTAFNSLALKEPITNVVQSNGSFANELDEKDFVGKARKNPDEIASAGAAIRANGGDNDAARALSRGMTRNDLRSIMQNYSGATKEPAADKSARQRNTLKSIDILQQSFTDAATEATDIKQKDEYTAMAKLLADNKVNLAPPATTNGEVNAVVNTRRAKQDAVTKAQAAYTAAPDATREEARATFEAATRVLGELDSLITARASAKAGVTREESTVRGQQIAYDRENVNLATNPTDPGFQAALASARTALQTANDALKTEQETLARVHNNIVSSA